MTLWWSQSATLKHFPSLSMSSKEQVPSQCQILFLGPLQILSNNSFRYYFVNNSAYFSLSSLCSSLCRSSCSSSRSSTSSHCVRYCAIGSSGNDVCKALMPPRSAHPYVIKEMKKKKKGSYTYYSAPKLHSRGHSIQKFFLRSFKA